MYLSDNSILRAVGNGEIQIFPSFKERHLRQVGLRVHLASKILIPLPGQIIDFEEPDSLKYSTHELRSSSLTLAPGMFVLASTIESIRTARNLICVLEGRSTMARLGITIHNTASVLDGADKRPLTPVLEITNHSNCSVVLREGVPIGMFCFARLESPKSDSDRNQQYANQHRTIGANMLSSSRIDKFDIAPDFEHDFVRK